MGAKGEQMTILFNEARSNSDIVDELCKILKRPQDQLLSAVRELKNEIFGLKSELYGKYVVRHPIDNEGNSGYVCDCPTDDNKKVCNCSDEAIGGVCCGCGSDVDAHRGERKSFPG